MRSRRNSLLIAISLFIALSGCASGSAPDILRLDPTLIMTPTATSDLPPREINEILYKIDKRNRTIEDDPEWIKKSYENLMVRRLTNISSKEYEAYRQYLDNGAAYIIIHPAFFTFFHYSKKKNRGNNQDDLYKLNIVEHLLRKEPKTSKFAVMQAQERRLRDFMEFKSTQNKLVILVVPQKYGEYSGYTYRNGPDEYMRFLNEITNFSHSVLFVESRSPNRGYLNDEDAMKLMELLLSIKADKVYVGGGYIGRCMEDFYNLISRNYGTEGLFVVPELSDISPRELNNRMSTKLLRPDGLIDDDYATSLLLDDTYKIQEMIPQIESLK